MRSLCISGGGSTGAWAGGIVQHLSESGIEWDSYFGTSTGSLMIPMIASNKTSELKMAYTSIEPVDIFRYNPFKVLRNVNGEFKFKLDHINIIRNFIKNGTKTLGDSSNLCKTINRFLSEEDFTKIKDSGKVLTISVCNLTTNELEFKTSEDESYSDFIDWMCASSSAVPFMSLLEKNGCEYADGAIHRYIPIIEAIESGSKEIDAIVLMEDGDKQRIEKVRNVLHLITRIINIFLSNRKLEDVDPRRLSKSIEKGREVKLNIYYLPRKLTNNPYIFDSKMMSDWWEEAYGVSKKGPNHSWILTKNKFKKNDFEY